MDYFICGNGFDIVHLKDKTKYSSFRKYLIDEHNINEDEKTYDLPSYSTNYKGLESFDEGEFAKLFVTLIDNAELAKYPSNHKISWNEFEDLLGEIDWTSIDTGAIEEYDKEGDINPWKTSDNYIFGASNAFESSHILKILFENWVKQIDVSTVKPKKEIIDFFTKNKLRYMSFNYTNILEQIYCINEVFHIHGCVEYYDDLIVGHNKDINKYLENCDDFLKEEAYEYLKGMHYEYLKNTDSIINNNKKIFKDMNTANIIYFYGFGFGNSDNDYVKEIIDNIGENTQIYLCKYQYRNNYNQIKNVFERNGYNKPIFEMDI